MRSSKSPGMTVTSCNVEGCDRPVRIKSRGLCARCYQKWRSYGDASTRLRNREHPATCTVDGCDKPYRANGRCNAHYKRARAELPDVAPIRPRGESSRPAYKTRITDPTERFWSRVLKTEGCWLWTGAPGSNGYGQVTFLGKHYGAHRLAWILTNGPITDGLQLDHLCRERLCVRPGHLEPVSCTVNLKRSPLTTNGRTHCKHGHEFSKENIYQTPKGRQCRACRRDRQRAARA